MPRTITKIINKLILGGAKRQRNPRSFYRSRFLSFNVPDFITAPTRFDTHQATRAINNTYRKPFTVRY